MLEAQHAKPPLELKRTARGADPVHVRQSTQAGPGRRNSSGWRAGVGAPALRTHPESRKSAPPRISSMKNETSLGAMNVGKDAELQPGEHPSALEGATAPTSEASAAFKPDSLKDDATAEIRAPPSQPAPMAPPVTPNARLGRYIVLDRVGEGGMGQVHAAYDPELDRKVALKLLQPSAAADGRARLLREAQAMARLSHPNVLPVHDVGTFEGQVFIAMELVEGQSLRDWRLEQAPPWREVLRHYREAGRGLAAAHAAGLIHRDFKPGNVLLGKDGRVRVMDFGLARQAGDRGWSPQSPTMVGPDDSQVSAITADLTGAGQVVGTLAYMAPEQFKGPADARSDQFSFCVTLYEGLYGVRPFPRKAHLIKSWKVSPAPKEAHVPAWLRAVLLRGLSEEPSARYPSMDALVDALSRDPQAQRQKWTWAVAGLLGVVGVAALTTQQMTARSRLCQDSAQSLAGVWDGARKAQLSRAFVATGLPGASESWNRLESTLDRYSASWVKTRTDACEATRVRGEQSDEVLSLRMACLDGRLQGLRSLSDALTQPDAAAVDASLRAAAALPGLEGCSQVAQLRARVRPPANAALRRQVEAIRPVLADARAALDLARYASGLARATSALEQARATHYPPVEAEAFEVVARLKEKSGRNADALEDFYNALVSAQAGGDDATTAAAALGLSRVEFVRARYSEAKRWGRYTEATLERLGGDAKLAGAQAMVLGLVALAEGQVSEGLTLCQQALALRIKAYGPEHPEVAESYNSLGRALYLATRDKESMGPLTRALEIWEKTLGPDHPDTAQALYNLGNTLEQLGRMEESLQRHERSLAIRRARLGPEHAELASSLGRTAALKARLGRPVEALRDIQEALRLSLKVYGPNHPQTADTYRNQGFIQMALELHKEAVSSYRHSLEGFVTLHGEHHAAVGIAHLYLGNALEEDGQMPEALAQKEKAVAVIQGLAEPDVESLAMVVDGLGGWYQKKGLPLQAVPYYEQSLRLWEQAAGAQNPKIAINVAQVASAWLDAKQPARALPILEGALTLAVPAQSQPGDLGDIKFMLARALWETRGDKARALALAAEAQVALAQSQYPAKRAELKKWLSTHTLHPAAP